MNGLDVTAELLTHYVMTQQLLLYPLSVGLRLVALVHCHDDRNCRTMTI